MFIGDWRSARLHAARKHAGRCTKTENLTKHRVSISTTMPADDRANSQPFSGLFRLPAEIRLYIYRCALAYDEFSEFSKASDGGPAPYGSLLLTCRLAWIEANMLPLALAMSFFNLAHGPEQEPSTTFAPVRVRQTRQAYLESSQREGRSMQDFFTCLTPLNRIDLANLTLNVNNITLEEWCSKEGLAAMLGKHPLYTKSLTLHIDGIITGKPEPWSVDDYNFSWLSNLFEGDWLLYVQDLKLEHKYEYAGEEVDRAANRARAIAVAELMCQTDGIYTDTAPVIEDWTQTEGEGAHAYNRHFCTITLGWTNTKLSPRKKLQARTMSHQIDEHILDQNIKPLKRGGGQRCLVVAARERKKLGKKLQAQQQQEEARNLSLGTKRLADGQVRLQMEKWGRNGSLMAFCNAR